MIIDAGSLGSGSDTLINFTLVPHDTPQCKSDNIGESLTARPSKLNSHFIVTSHMRPWIFRFSQKVKKESKFQNRCDDKL